MPIEIIVPAVGESIREATISRWFKKVGDAVALDEPMFEIETDKITTEVNAPQSGTITDILHGAGELVQIGAIVAHMEAGAAPAKAPVEAPSANKTNEAAPILSPSARVALRETGVALDAVTGTGPGGRITKQDIHTANTNAPLDPAAPVKDLSITHHWIAPVIPAGAPKTNPPRPAPSPRNGLREEVVPMTTLRKRIAERLVEAQHTAAILTTFNEIDMSKVIELRKKYQEKFEKRHGVKLGFMSFFVKAAVEALQQYPAVNAEMRETDVVYKKYYDIGVAVGGGKGLVVPIVRNADQLGFAQVELTINELAKKAKDNKLSLQDLQGGTFTISNGGIYGSMLSTPILNPPQTGILGMHKIEERAVVVDGQIVARPMMYVALSYDHRLIDGREAVLFLVRVKECIEDPERLLLEV
jgi:2-oxoglutarate dehydrogenase E2 component (dihydrolipoamide succinyltransferase)